MTYRVHYRDLANDLARLPLSATCADLRAKLETYFASDPEYGAHLAESLAHLSSDTEWLAGAFALCDALKADNSRFQPGLMLDALTEDI